MKNTIILSAIVFLLGALNNYANAQCSKNCTNCKKEQTDKVNKGIMKEGTGKTLSCKLTSPELRKRKEEVIANLKKQVLEKTELENGYSYKFNGIDETLDMLTDFVKSERQCCDFFNFRIKIESGTFIWLDIYGQKGAKEFISTELEM